MNNPIKTSKKLNDIKNKLPDGNISLNDLIKILSDEGFQFLVIILLAPFLFPVSIPGSSTPFGILIILLEITFLRNKTLHVPNFVGKYEMSKDNVLRLFNILNKVFKYIEKISKPRGSLYLKTYARALNAVITIFLALLLFLPLPVPFTDFFPSFSMLILALSELEQDSYLMILGFISGILTFLYFTSLGYLGVEVINLTLNYFGII